MTLQSLPQRQGAKLLEFYNHVDVFCLKPKFSEITFTFPGIKVFFQIFVHNICVSLLMDVVILVKVIIINFDPNFISLKKMEEL